MSQELNATINQQLMGLSTLLQLEKQARQARDLPEFGFITVNETLRLIHYHQGVFCSCEPSNRPRVVTISGVPDHEENSPYIRWLNRLLTHLLKKFTESGPQPVSIDDLPRSLREGFREWAAQKGLWLPLQVNGMVIGGLWLTRDLAWSEPELGLLSQLCDDYANSLFTIINKPPWWHKPLNFSGSGAIIKIIIAALLLALLLAPIRLSVLAPAKIIAINPKVITSPLNGVIKTIQVQPNQEVAKGQPLFSLDDTELRNQYQVARKALAVVETARFIRLDPDELVEVTAGHVELIPAVIQALKLLMEDEPASPLEDLELEAGGVRASS